MKRNVSLRLKLHRETLRTLASPELEGAQGGMNTTVGTLVTRDRISCGGTCGAVTCGVICAPSVVCPSHITC